MTRYDFLWCRPVVLITDPQLYIIPLLVNLSCEFEHIFQFWIDVCRGIKVQQRLNSGELVWKMSKYKHQNSINLKTIGSTFAMASKFNIYNVNLMHFSKHPVSLKPEYSGKFV